VQAAKSGQTGSCVVSMHRQVQLGVVGVLVVTTDIKTIDSGFSKNSEAQKVPRPSPHMHDKYLIYFELKASLI